MTLIELQPLLRNMPEYQAVISEQQEEGTSSNAEVFSYRSRASSVISTGTKFSIATTPQGHFHSGHSDFGGATPQSNLTRQNSIYSMRSIAPSLPPYDDHSPRPPPIQIPAPNPHDPNQPLTPSTADPENALSIHYGRVVRTIDENHARQLTRIYEAHDQQIKAHEAELAATREAIDQAYRKEWKAQTREMERVREEAAATVAAMQQTLTREVDLCQDKCARKVSATETELRALNLTHAETLASMRRDADERIVMLTEENEAAVERARNAIEDLWEGRWNDRTRLAAEEGERRVRERDEVWLGLVERRCHPELVGELRDAMLGSKGLER